MSFGRQVILEIGVEGTVGRQFTGLRVRFRVDRTRESTPDKAVLEVYNLNQASLALIQVPLCQVRLYAGYDVPTLIFQGNPIKNGISVVKEGPDRILRIEAADGQRALAASRIALSFAGGTTLGTVFSSLTAALALPVGILNLGAAAGIVLTQGVVLSGSTKDLLDQVCRTGNLDWFISDGVLQIVPRDGTTGILVPVFSSLTGNLIGSPRKTDKGVEIVALLSPTLRPGKLFQVVSEAISGLFVCDSLTFQGDSGWERDFYVIARGHPQAAA